jgi:hypothetical protein
MLQMRPIAMAPSTSSRSKRGIDSPPRWAEPLRRRRARSFPERVPMLVLTILLSVDDARASTGIGIER